MKIKKPAPKTFYMLCNLNQWSDHAKNVSDEARDSFGFLIVYSSLAKLKKKHGKDAVYAEVRG